MKIIGYAILVFILGGCLEGPAGPTGETGPKGNTGDPGPSTITIDGYIRRDTAQSDLLIPGRVFWIVKDTRIRLDNVYSVTIAPEVSEYGWYSTSYKINPPGGSITIWSYSDYEKLVGAPKYWLYKIVVGQ